MEREILRRVISMLLCFTLISTTVFAQTFETLHIHNKNCSDSDWIDYDLHKHIDDIFTQDEIILNNEKKLVVNNDNIVIENEHNLLIPEIISFQNNIISPYMIENEILEYELLFISELMQRDVSDISYSTILYDLDNRPIYHLAEFYSGGYIIVLRTHNAAMELSYVSKGSPYPQNNSTKKYYAGMLSYAVESNGQIISLATQSPISRDSISASKEACDALLNKISSSYQKNNTKTTYMSQSELQTLYKQDLLHIIKQSLYNVVEVPNSSYFLSIPFGHNTIGDCGPTAAAMLMRYYDDNINSGILDINKAHVDDEWKEALKSYSSTGNVAGTTAFDEEDKINVYLGEYKLNMNYHAKAQLLSEGKAEVLIGQGKPVVLYAATVLPDFMMHAVLAYGYQNNMYKIHTGWHSNRGEILGCPGYLGVSDPRYCLGGTRSDIWLSSYLIGSILWLDTIPSSHTHNFKHSTDSTNHQLICSGCGLKKMIEEHSLTLDENKTSHFEICEECNYVYDCGGFVSFATCTSPRKCQDCNKVFGTALGHKYSQATCTNPSKCTKCDIISGEPLGHNYRPATCITPMICIRCDVRSGSPLGHSYSSATCTEASKCTRCGSVSGTALGHNYSLATCTSASKCTRCGSVSGTALGHNYSLATCTSASKCTRCGVVSGTALGHNYSSATCTSASKCTRCGAVSGTALGHNYSSATCTSAQKCARCGATSGTALGHNYSSATCTSASKCTRCGATSGTELGHNWVSGTCTYRKCSRCNSSVGSSNHSWAYGACTYKFCDICGSSSGSTSHNWVNGTCTYKSCAKCGSSSGSTSHSYSAATCTKPKTCTKCGATSGSKLGHNIVGGRCTRCNVSVNSIKEDY